MEATSTPVAPAPEPAPPPKRRLWLRLVVFAVVLPLTVVLVAPHAIALEVVKDKVVDALRQQLGTGCRITRLGFSWFQGIAVQGLEIDQPPGFAAPSPAVRVGRAALDVSLPDLVRGRFAVRGTVDGLHLRLDRNDDGTTNLAALAAAAEPTEPGEPPVAEPSDTPTRVPHDLSLQLQLRGARVDVHQAGRVVESLQDLDCTLSAPGGAQAFELDLSTNLAAKAPEQAPGRLVVHGTGDLALSRVDLLLTTTALDLARFEPLLAVAWPGRIDALAGVADGTVNARLVDRRTVQVGGDLRIAGPRLAGPLLQGMDVRAERWSLAPALLVTLGDQHSPPLADLSALVVDLGFLKLRGLDAAAKARLLDRDDGVAFGYEVDLDALAGFGGPMPAWLAGARGSVTGSAALPFAALTTGTPVAALLERLLVDARIRLPRLAAAGFEFRDVDLATTLRGGALQVTSGEGTRLNLGGLELTATADVRQPDRVPASLTLRWKGGQLQPELTSLLQYAVPVLAGAGSTARLSGLCDFECAFRGPALRVAGQNWLQLLGEWSGSGKVGLRQASVAPAPALRSLLQPLAGLPGAQAAGDGGRLAIDDLATEFTLRRGSLENKLGRWTTKGRTIGITGTTRLDGTLDHAFDCSDLLRGHRDGERVLAALGGTLPALRLSGTVDAPSLATPDLAELAKKALQGDLGRKASDLLQRGIDDLLKRKR